MRKTILIKKIFLLSALSIVISSCSSNVPLYYLPVDWKEAEVREKTILDYSVYLKGKKIFLDPGHGGEDRKNSNRSGDVIEADVNLKVALFLRDYFNRAGVEVIMSREKDQTVQLGFRSELANSSSADIFISIHHNAPSKWEDDWTNYTSTYYHAKETDYEYEPSERDLARYIQRDLSYVMGNPGGLGSFDGTYSDYIIYPGDGFSVLRKTTIQSVLVECAFHTSSFEELRLNDEIFNQIQAWGIFRGVAKYFRAGIPKIYMLADSLKNIDGNISLTFSLKDSSGINPKSIQVFLNKEEIQFKYDSIINLLKIDLTELPIGVHQLRVICANKNGNHSLPFHKKIEITDSLKINILDQ
jgi:N-acetylmuramoyl-L-alanine amidase